MPDWKLCEGELAGGKFPLERYIGGREASAVFLTRFGSGRAAIKLVPAGQAETAELVERWNRSGRLHHPHLIRIFEAGTWVLANVPLAYLVMEYAGENLAEVLRERPLTTDETREMLQPVADALAYLHGQGLVHGDLKPSNVLAVEDTVKISIEAVSVGDAAADIRALGVTLVQALTVQGLTVQALTRQAATVGSGSQDATLDALPVPFRELAQNCLHDDPRLRWSAARIGAWLRSPDQPASTSPAAAVKARPRHYVGALTLLAVGVVIVGGLMMHRTAAPVASAPEPVRPASGSAPPGPAPVASPPPTPSPTAPSPTMRPPAPDGITRRVLPDIPAKARDTVHGKATVVVRVAVDPSGQVTEAALEPGGSPYFGKLSLEAARHWQFATAESEAPRNWILRFEITRTATQVVARRGRP